MIIIIPCAGYGTRLQSVSGNVPKSLMDIAGKPLLSRIIENLRALNPEKIIIITNDKFHEQFVEWKHQFKEDVELINDGTRSNEERLGATRDVYLGVEKYDSEFMVYLGDNLLLGNLNKPFQMFKSKNINIVMLKDIQDLNAAKKFGVVEINENNKIVDIEEKPEHPKTTFISTGIYFCKPEVKKSMKKYVDDPNNPETFGSFLDCTLAENDFYGMMIDDAFEWIDIGSPESLERARGLFK